MALSSAFDPAARNPAGQFSERDLERLKALRASKVWAAFEGGFDAWREALFGEEPSTTRQLWMKEGQLQLLTYLLNHGPAFVIHWERLNRRRKRAQERDSEGSRERVFDQTKMVRRRSTNGASGPGAARYTE